MRYFLIFFISLSFLFSFQADALSADVLIIANKNTPVSSINERELRKIFLGKIVKWNNGTPIHFAILENSDVHRKFLRTYILKSKTQYDNWWQRMLFAGKGYPPKKFETLEALIKYLAETDGAIGYCDERTFLENIKTIEVK